MEGLPADPTKVCTEEPLLGPDPTDAPDVVDENLREIQNPHKEWKADEKEKIAIIDFGAQYGKVLF